jgi:hypothetical protein
MDPVAVALITACAALKRMLRAIESAGQQAAVVEIEGGRVRIRLKDGSEMDGSKINDSAEWDAKYGKA